MKKIKILFLTAVFMAFSGISSFAYDIPYNSYRIQCNTNIGRLEIAVPINYKTYLTWEENNIVNQSSSQITCYANNLDNSNEYTIRFPSFDIPTYRLSSSNTGTYQDLIINSIVYTNLPNLNESDFTIFSQNTLVNMMMVMCAGSVLILLLKRR